MRSCRLAYATARDSAVAAWNSAASAARYELSRPDYSPEAIASLVEGALLAGQPSRGIVVDLGAGTGKMTRAVHQHLLACGDPRAATMVAVSVASVGGSGGGECGGGGDGGVGGHSGGGGDGGGGSSTQLPSSRVAVGS